MAMAQDDGPSSTSDIAHRMGISMTNASNLRRRLITRGVIGEVRLGQVGFELPMLREFLRAQDARAGLF
jgi:Mn-dependent DtxR family transcriptional regulator